MVRDVLAITATIVILAVGTAFAFWDVVSFGQTITEPQTVAPKPAARERPAARVTLPVQDPQKRADVAIGDPAVATSKPEDIAASPVESQVTLTVAVVTVDGTNGMLPIKDPEGDAEPAGM